MTPAMQAARLARDKLEKIEGVHVMPDGDRVYIRNIAVNCGAMFSLTKERYGELRAQGKANNEIFDILAGEDTRQQATEPEPDHPYAAVGSETSPKEADRYRKECKVNRLKYRIGEFAENPGHLPHLGVTITEEVI
jgi:hypothetical protein